MIPHVEEETEENPNSWRSSPNKPRDARYLGKPGEVKETRITGKKVDYKASTKIGNDGKAIMERHWTDHNNDEAHSNPHDHPIDWSKGYPDPGKQINYPDGNIPEFKKFELEAYIMEKNNEITVINVEDANFDFESIGDFKDCMNRHGEVGFTWNNKDYGITHPNKTILYEAHKPETTVEFNSIDEILDHKIDGEPLKNIVTKLEVWDRTV